MSHPSDPPSFTSVFHRITRWAGVVWADTSLLYSFTLGVSSVLQRFLGSWPQLDAGSEHDAAGGGGVGGGAANAGGGAQPWGSSGRTPPVPPGLPHRALYDDVQIHDCTHPDGSDAGRSEPVSFYTQSERGIVFGVGTASFLSVLGQVRGGRGNIPFDGQSHGLVSGALKYGHYYWAEELLHKMAMAMMLGAVTFSSFLRLELASMTDMSVGSDAHVPLAELLHKISGSREVGRDTRLLRSFIGAYCDWIVLQPIDFQESLRCRCAPRRRLFVNIEYDNACNAMVYILNKAPLMILRYYNFFVDGFHWKDHTLCSWFFNASACLGLRGVNSQVSYAFRIPQPHTLSTNPQSLNPNP